MDIAVCDDNKLQLEIMCGVIDSFFVTHNRHARRIEQYSTGADMIRDYRCGKWHDLILLDVHLENEDGVEIARQLRKLGYKQKIAFWSASKDSAVDAFEVGASEYLIKGGSPQRLEKMLLRVLNQIDTATIAIRSGAKTVRIRYKDIIYAESDKNKCIIHCDGNEHYITYRKLDDIEAKLNDARFLRCKKSYLVNMDFVKAVGDAFEMFSGAVVDIRQRDSAAIREKFVKYVHGKNI